MTRRLLSLAFPFMDNFPTAHAEVAATDETLHMDEDAFRGFYSRTSGMLWAYLSRATGDPSAADDLLPAKPRNARRMLNDAEVVTLCVAQSMMGIPSDERFLKVAGKQLRHLFGMRESARL